MEFTKLIHHNWQVPLKGRNIINRTWKAELSQQLNLIVLKLFGAWGGGGKFGFLPPPGDASRFGVGEAVSRVAPEALVIINICTECSRLQRMHLYIAHLMLVTRTASCVTLGTSPNLSGPQCSFVKCKGYRHKVLCPPHLSTRVPW